MSIFFRQFERGHAILTFVILLSSLDSGEERTSKSHHNSKVRNASPSVERASFAKLKPDLQAGNSIASQLAYSEAIKLRAEWKAESFQKATKKYLKAQSYWQTGNDRQQGARALKDAAALRVAQIKMWETR